MHRRLKTTKFAFKVLNVLKHSLLVDKGFLWDL